MIIGRVVSIACELIPGSEPQEIGNRIVIELERPANPVEDPYPGTGDPSGAFDVLLKNSEFMPATVGQLVQLQITPISG